jgi:hypothetical protein
VHGRLVTVDGIVTGGRRFHRSSFSWVWISAGSGQD